MLIHLSRKLIQLHKLSIHSINLHVCWLKCWLLCSNHCSCCASSDNCECGYCDEFDDCYSFYSVVCYQESEDKKQVKTTIVEYIHTQLLYTCTVGTATKLQALVEVPVKDNPAYQLISLQESHQESARTSMHVTTPPTHQASPQYENIVEVDEECGGDHENMKE